MFERVNARTDGRRLASHPISSPCEPSAQVSFKRYDMIDAFITTPRYLDDLLNIDNIHFEQVVHRIYPAELQLNKANASDTKAAF